MFLYFASKLISKFASYIFKNVQRLQISDLKHLYYPFLTYFKFFSEYFNSLLISLVTLAIHPSVNFQQSRVSFQR